jgi:cytoskeletal protein CcmA (bactofilin family)
VNGKVNGKINCKSIIIMENGNVSGDVLYNKIAVFEGGTINVSGMKKLEEETDKVIDIVKKVGD